VKKQADWRDIQRQRQYDQTAYEEGGWGAAEFMGPRAISAGAERPTRGGTNVGGGNGSGTSRGTGTNCGPVVAPCSTQHDGTRLGSQVGVMRSAACTAVAVPNNRAMVTPGRRMRLPAVIRSGRKPQKGGDRFTYQAHYNAHLNKCFFLLISSFPEPDNLTQMYLLYDLLENREIGGFTQDTKHGVMECNVQDTVCSPPSKSEWDNLVKPYLEE
jgi:hypothetical protein